MGGRVTWFAVEDEGSAFAKERDSAKRLLVVMLSMLQMPGDEGRMVG